MSQEGILKSKNKVISFSCSNFAPNSNKMDITSRIRLETYKIIQDIYQISLEPDEIQINETKPEFEGDYTVVLFPFVKKLKKKPEDLGNEIGKELNLRYPDFIGSFNIIKGFLNLSISDGFWVNFLKSEYDNNSFGSKPAAGKKVMVEYSSPNTNKPLHLGHLRNNFLGWTIASLHRFSGYDTVKSCIANDRGIHICKSMIAWQKFGRGATPESTGIKGDHLVGDYYVLFGEIYKQEVQQLVKDGMSEESAEREAPLMKAAQQMLIDWEAGKPEVIALWKKMNDWVYKGFEETYRRIGSDFDKIYYESDTYLLGKDLIEFGLQKKVFYKKEDGSVWIDLTADGLDEKIVQRKDGTAVYITQDIGLVKHRYDDYHCDLTIYTVADEQNYHFKVLKLIAQKLELPSAEGLFHLSYGLVELPTGRMKTREGTVVDADDLIDEMVSIARQHTEELGKVQDFSPAELEELYNMLGLGALKFYLLRVDPKKKIVFNPEESIDFHGFTGPFVQYTHARIKSILRKEGTGRSNLLDEELEADPLLALEKAVIIQLEKYPITIEQALAEMNPSLLAIYGFNLAKIFNSFYTEHSVARAESVSKKILRLALCQLTAKVLKSAMALLGIHVPERM